MSFITDKQTTDDLNILGKFKAHSIFSIFNKTVTTGGERLLEEMFKTPLTEAEAINQRSAIFSYFQQKELAFPLKKAQVRAAETYLDMVAAPSVLFSAAGILRKKLMKAAIRDEQYTQWQEGLQAMISVLQSCCSFLKQLSDYPNQDQLQPLRRLLNDPRLSSLLKSEQAGPNHNFSPQNGRQSGTADLPLMQSARYHHLLLQVFRKEVEQLFVVISQWDVSIAVSTVARERGYCYAQALPKEEYCFNALALRHPALEKAVANPLVFNIHQNLLFLTGANMAGKSTFMKAFGIAVYMAHMGFPVAAGKLTFSIRDGLYTSINVPDNLNMGYSHFYAEVLRVKQVAQTVADGADIVVIFDELFKGTNVKDAYDATLSVTEAFAAYRSCFFIISTHIIEVGEALQRETGTIRFSFLPTIMDGHTPRYTYHLEEGITNDRQGMMIIQNEGIPAMLSGNLSVNVQ